MNQGTRVAGDEPRSGPGFFSPLKRLGPPRVALLCAVVILSSAAETVAAGKDGARAGGAPPKTAAARPAPADAPLFKVGDRVMAEVELEALLKQDLKNQHMQSYRPLVPDFDKLLGLRVDGLLLVAEARRLGLDRQVEQGSFRLQRNYVFFKDFLRNGLRPSIRVEPAEIEAKMPQELRYFTIRQIVLGTQEEAESCAKELAAGADFLALIQERSIGPEARKEGLLWRYRAGDGIFPEAIEKYLFALPTGVYSKVFEIGIGFVVARVEKVDEPPAGTREKLRAKIESQLAQKRFNEERERIIQSAAKKVMSRDVLAPIVTDWLLTGKVVDAVVVEVPGDMIRFSEMVVLEKGIPDQPWKKGTDENDKKGPKITKFLEMGRSLAVEHVVAREAERRGYVLTEAARQELEALKSNQMLEMLYAKQVEAGVAVTPEEVRGYFEKNIKNIAAQSGEQSGERKAPVFEDLKGQIEQRLLEERRAAARDDYLKKLRTGVVYFDENLAKFRARFIKTNMAAQAAAPAVLPAPPAPPPSHGKP